MEEVIKIEDIKTVAIELKKKMGELGITNEEFLNIYGEELEEGELECMLNGNYMYNSRMNKVASHFLKIQIDCEKKFDLIYSFRKGNGNGDIDKFISKLDSKFHEMILKRKNGINVKYRFDNPKEFEKKFNIQRPLTIENFLEMNYSKDNFIVIMNENQVGISGLAIRIYRNNIGYNCIYINTGEPYGRQIFTFFHELYHIYFEKSDMHILKKDEYSDNGHKIESKAHRFASDLIINSVELMKLLRDNNMSNHRNIEYKDVYYLQKKFNATFQAIIYKIEQLEKDIINYIKSKNSPNELLEIKNAIQNIPRIPSSLKKYYNETMWQELNDKIKNEDPNNTLNFPTYENNEYDMIDDAFKDVVK